MYYGTIVEIFEGRACVRPETPLSGRSRIENIWFAKERAKDAGPVEVGRRVRFEANHHYGARPTVRKVWSTIQKPPMPREPTTTTAPKPTPEPMPEPKPAPTRPMPSPITFEVNDSRNSYPAKKK